jgi:large subunit ribosomal protein L31
MKKGIHPKYNNEIVVTCACGNTFTTGSTSHSISVEICSKCHPFWTGKDTFVDIEGRVDQFKRKQEVGSKARNDRIKKLKEKIEKEKTKQEAPKTLKDMLKSIQ